MNDSKTSSSFAIYKRLLRYVRPYRMGFFASFIALLITAATESSLPALMKELFDSGFGSAGTIPLWMVPLVIIGLALVRGLAGFGGTYAMAWVANHTLKDLRREMFDRFLTLPTPVYDHQSSGLLISKIVSEVNTVLAAATSVVATVIRDGLIVMGLLGYMLWMNWQLTLVVLLVVPSSVLMARHFGKRIRQIARKSLTMTGQMTSVVEEAIAAHRVIKVFGGQDYERKRFAEANLGLRHQSMRLVIAQGLQSPFSQFIGAAALSIVIAVAMTQANADKTSAGEFIAFIGALLLLLQPLKHLAEVNGLLQRGLAGAEAVFSVIDFATEIDTGTKTIDRAEGTLRFQGVSLVYPTSERPALQNINLDINAGETIAFVGPSGAGKSTLVSLVPRFYALTEGEILLDGVPISGLTLNSLRQQMALVSQDVLLFNDTIGSNIAYARKEQVTEHALLAAVEAAGLSEFIESLPKGLDTEVGDRGVRLSGGQRQRVAIARAILKDAPILILDEATSALDSETEQQVQSAIDALRQNRTTLVIAHRLSTIENADRIVVMDQGRIVEIGDHQSLIRQEGLYARLHRIQQLPSLNHNPPM